MNLCFIRLYHEPFVNYNQDKHLIKESSSDEDSSEEEIKPAQPVKGQLINFIHKRSSHYVYLASS